MVLASNFVRCMATKMVVLTTFEHVITLTFVVFHHCHLQKSPLLLAAKNGHTKCVTHLLQKGAKVIQTDNDGNNCLVLAVQNLHEYVS